MSNFKINDFEFDVQDLIHNQGMKKGEASGQDFKKIYSQANGDKLNKGAATWVKEKGADSIRHLEPDEKVDLNRVEQAGFTTPFNTAGEEIEAINLTVSERNWHILREHLLREDRLERQSFLELGLLEREGRKELFLHKLLLVPDSEYLSQSSVQVMASGKFTVAAYNSFAKSGVAVHGHVHSHPFTGHASFSGVDVDCRERMMGGVLAVAEALHIEPPIYSLLMVMGTDLCGWFAELVGSDNRVIGQVETVTIVGPSGGTRLKRGGLGKSAPANLLARAQKGLEWLKVKEQSALLDRNIRLLGEKGQARIATKHLALCGAGGAGAMLVANLRGMGFKEFTLIDPERLEASNLNRFPGAGVEDIDTFKVEILKRELQRVFPDTVVHALHCGVEEEQAREALIKADIIVAGVDGMAPRAELQVLAARLLKPLFDLGTGIRLNPERKVIKMGGQIIAYLPGGPCLLCQGMDIFRPEAGLAGKMRRATGYVEETDFTPTSVAFINSMAAGLAADLLVSYVTGLRPIPAYLEFDQWSWQINTYNYARRPHCGVCGEAGIEGKGLPTVFVLPPSPWATKKEEHDDLVTDQQQ